MPCVDLDCARTVEERSPLRDAREEVLYVCGGIAEPIFFFCDGSLGGGKKGEKVEGGCMGDEDFEAGGFEKLGAGGRAEGGVGGVLAFGRRGEGVKG